MYCGCTKLVSKTIRADNPDTSGSVFRRSHQVHGQNLQNRNYLFRNLNLYKSGRQRMLRVGESFLLVVQARQIDARVACDDDVDGQLEGADSLLAAFVQRSPTGNVGHFL